MREYAGGAADGYGAGRDGAGDHRAGADGRAGADIGHDDGGRADPAIGADFDHGKLAASGAGDLPGWIARMLAASAEDLNSGSDLRAGADDGLPEDAIGADVHAGAEFGVGMSKKGTERNAAGKVAFRQRELVKRDAQVVPKDARDEGADVGE